MLYLFISSVSSGNWSLVRGSGQALPAVSDGYNDTCHGLDLEGRRVLMKSDLEVSFKTLQVTVLIAGGEIAFFPNTYLVQCKKPTSLLMTHDSSMAKTRGHPCKPFCEVPGLCWFEEMGKVAADVTNYKFTCVCPYASCNELLVMFPSETVQGRISICEVQLIYP